MHVNIQLRQSSRALMTWCWHVLGYFPVSSGVNDQLFTSAADWNPSFYWMFVTNRSEQAAILNCCTLSAFLKLLITPEEGFHLHFVGHLAVKSVKRSSCTVWIQSQMFCRCKEQVHVLWSVPRRLWSFHSFSLTEEGRTRSYLCSCLWLHVPTRH